MAPKVKKSLPPRLFEEREALKRLPEIVEYAPANPALSLDALRAKEARVAASLLAEARSEAALEAARQQALEDAWSFHDDFISVKYYLRSHFGADSLVLHTVGLKRSSERKRPARRKKVQL